MLLPEYLLLFGLLILLLNFAVSSTSIKYNVLVDYSGLCSVYLLILTSALNLYVLSLNPLSLTVFSASMLINAEVVLVKSFILFIGILIFLVSNQFFTKTLMGYFEYNLLVLSSVLGCLLIVSANDFLILYISLEIVALSFYIIATIKKTLNSTEAGLKYFVVGSFSSAIFLFGTSIIVLFSGLYNFQDIVFFLYFFNVQESFFNNQVFCLLLGILLILSSLLIKLGVAPFHEWVPDVYEGIMSPTALLFSTIPKIAIFYIFTQLLLNVFFSFFAISQIFVGFCCVLSLILGSLMTVKQTKIKRYLALSSVNHFGFMLIGLVVGDDRGVTASFTYLFIYILLSATVWSTFVLLSFIKHSKSKKKVCEIIELKQLNGLYIANPALSYQLTFLLLSMGGMPPFVGFFGKVTILSSLFAKLSMVANWSNPVGQLAFINLHLILGCSFFSSALAVFYYIRIVKVMYFTSHRSEKLIVGSEPSIGLGYLFLFNLCFVFVFLSPTLPL